MRITARMTTWGKRAALAGLTVGLLAGAVACTSTPSSAGSAVAVAGVTKVSSAAAVSAGASAAAPEVTVSGAPTSSPAVASTPSALAPTTSTSLPPPKPAADVVASPALGASDLDPAAPISIAVKNGTIKSLQVVNPAGKTVTGKLSADDSSWKLGEDLGYGKTYTVHGSAGNRGKLGGHRIIESG